jgi:hypothetical protein
MLLRPSAILLVNQSNHRLHSLVYDKFIFEPFKVRVARDNPDLKISIEIRKLNPGAAKAKLEIRT